MVSQSADRFFESNLTANEALKCHKLVLYILCATLFVTSSVTVRYSCDMGTICVYDKIGNLER